MVSNIITEERLTKYLKSAGYDQEYALALYGWNIQLSESFFPVLSAAEVCLRNTIVAKLLETYGDTWWLEDAFHQQVRGNGKRIVMRAHDKLKKIAKVTSGRMTGELNFGFWVKMLLLRHQDALWHDLHTAFPNLPEQVTYERLFKRCDEVREFRNRVFHHEPILHLDNSLEYKQIMELIRWLSPAKADWIKKYSRAMSVMRERPKKAQLVGNEPNRKK